MMGRTHAASGAVATMLAIPALGRFGLDTTSMSVIAASVAGAGAAMLPDLDHPHATVAQSLGPVTRSIARVISAISGGHRHGTHSLIGVAAFTAITYGITRAGHVYTGLWLAFLFAIAATAFGVPVNRNRMLHTVICLAGGVLLAGTTAFIHYPLASLPWAVPIGSAAHLAGDLVTKQGVPLLWPIRHQFKLGHVTTGGDIDTILGWLLTFAYAVLVSYALYVIFLPPLHFAWSGH